MVCGCLVTSATIFAVLFALVYLYLKRTYSHWERNGIKTLPGYNFLLGHFKSNFPPKKPITFLIRDLYNATTEPFVGIYTVLRPVLLVRDPELIKTILIKDFSYFTDRRVQSNEDYDPFQGNLFNLSGHKWKPLRAKLTPAFTSGKLKAMFSTLIDCGSSLQNYLDNLTVKGVSFDVREIAASYTTNVIASVAFGIDVDTITDPNNDFRKYGRKFFQQNFWNSIKRIMLQTMPKLIRFFRIKMLDSDARNFIKSMVKENLEYREKNNVVRKDFFQLLIQLRNNGTVQLDDEWETVIEADSKKALTLDEITAQTFIFYLAGFETSSSTLSFCLYELSKIQEIQQRVHEEIDRITRKHDGKITYESISEMKYLESCIDETLRKYPILGTIPRACVKDFPIPGSNCVIKKGTEIFIPAYALQMDEKYYEEPNKFNPDRFNEENSAGKNQTNQPYYPFGDGPRNCIGLRLGKMQTKVGLVLMLKKCRFELESRYKNRELEFDPKSFLLAPLGGIHLNVFKRE